MLKCLNTIRSDCIEAVLGFDKLGPEIEVVLLEWVFRGTGDFKGRGSDFRDIRIVLPHLWLDMKVSLGSHILLAENSPVGITDFGDSFCVNHVPHLRSYLRISFCCTRGQICCIFLEGL